MANKMRFSWGQALSQNAQNAFPDRDRLNTPARHPDMARNLH
jgi:hypothetical protein